MPHRISAWPVIHGAAHVATGYSLVLVLTLHGQCTAVAAASAAIHMCTSGDVWLQPQPQDEGSVEGGEEGSACGCGKVAPSGCLDAANESSVA
jgi:hypothetical protein